MERKHCAKILRFPRKELRSIRSKLSDLTRNSEWLVRIVILLKFYWKKYLNLTDYTLIIVLVLILKKMKEIFKILIIINVKYFWLTEISFAPTSNE